MNIKSLEKQIEIAEQNLLEKKESITSNDPFALASYNSFQAHIDSLRTELYNLQTKREKEVLEVRFIGEQALNGALPLTLHAKLSAGLADSLIALSTRIKNPKKNGLAKNQAELDLRLAQIVSGSTKFVLSLEINPDLFGWSLSQTTLKQWFTFFNEIDSPSNKGEAVLYLGPKAIKGVKTLFKTLQDSSLDLELAWNSHINENYYWVGDTKKISTLLTFLNELNINEPIEYIVTGIVQSLDRSGKISILDEDKNIYRIHFDRTALSEIEKLHINQNVSIKTLKLVSSHPTLEKNIENYDFIEIHSF